MKGFMQFIREQGVVGLAVGFILGGAVSKVVASLVQDVINPLLGLALKNVGNLSTAVLELGGSTIYWGKFTTAVIDFIIVALVVYIAVKKLRLDERLDIKNK